MSEFKCGCGRSFVSLRALTLHKQNQECCDSAVLTASPEDMVNHPSHYTAYPVEVIDMIKSVLGLEGFKAYCLGNEIKYRMRAGLKGDTAEDLAKAMKYKQFREEA